MAEPDLQQRDQESAEQLAFELKKTKERQKKLEEALYEVFPLETYIQARPDVEKTFDGESQRIVEHFVQTGINEIDIKAESQKNKLGHLNQQFYSTFHTILIHSISLQYINIFQR